MHDGRHACDSLFRVGTFDSKDISHFKEVLLNLGEMKHTELILNNIAKIIYVISWALPQCIWKTVKK